MPGIYTHEPLRRKSIRLVTLFPGHGEVQISLSQKKFTKVKGQRYEALSYTWGDPTKTVGSVEVILERATVSTEDREPKPRKGRHRQQPVQVSPTAATLFPITENLYSALLHLRGNKPRVLWIDAICIDQSNLQEKSHQILKMGNIFKNADRVIVWLGPTSENSTKALEVLSHLGKQVEADLVTMRVQKHPDCEVGYEDWYKNDFVLPYDVSTWQAFRGVFSKPWFTRVWIRQEIGLADQTRALVQCGDTSIRWEHFGNAVVKINAGAQNRPKIDLEQFDRALHLVWGIVMQNLDTLLIEMLDTARRSSCFDPRDRLFAVLDISYDSSSFGIQPNYKKSVFEIFKDFFITHCQVSNSVALLQYCDARGLRTHQPSWVPLWDEALPYRDSLDGQQPSSAIGTFEFLEDGTLGVNGIFCGIINDCTSLAPYLALEDVAPLIRLWIKDELNLNQIVEEYGILCDIFLDRLVRDMYLKETGFISLAEGAAVIKQILQCSTQSDLLEILRLPGALGLLDPMSILLTGRRMFRTEAGHVGLGPSFIQPGDSIYAILGCPRLMVLRGNVLKGTYRIVGHCNLQDFMDLQALLGALPSGFQVKNNEFACETFDAWFVDQNGSRSRIDPRIGEGYSGWDSEERDEDGCIVWKNIKTGERTSHDPRHSDIDFLRKRGTKVECILLD